MKSIPAVLTVSVLSALLSVASAEIKHGTKDEAVALVKKAVAHFKAAGAQKAFADFNTKGGPFTDRDLYVFATDMTGKALAHGANDKLVGKDLLQLKDADGKAFVVEMLDKGKAGKPAWTDYKWPNPVTKELEAKTTYCEPAEGHLFCVGAYK